MREIIREAKKGSMIFIEENKFGVWEAKVVRDDIVKLTYPLQEEINGFIQKLFQEIDSSIPVIITSCKDRDNA